MPLYDTINTLEPIQLCVQLEATTDENLREYLSEQTELFTNMAARGQRCVSVHKDLDAGVAWALDLAAREGLAIHPALRRDGARAFDRVRSA